MIRNMVRSTIATAALLLLAGSALAQQPAVDVKGVTRKLIAEHVLGGYLTELNGKYKMTVAEFTIAPGGYFGPHLHAGPGFRCMPIPVVPAQSLGT
jgi:quercetin dioxygenase-like cupin family protein